MVSAMGVGARSEDALAALLLTTRLGEAEEEPLSPARFWSLMAAVPAPAELLATAKAVGGAATEAPAPVRASGAM